MFHPCLAQYLLTNNAIASLEDIRVIAEVSCYWATLTNKSIEQRNVARAEAALQHAREKKLLAKAHLF